MSLSSLDTEVARLVGFAAEVLAHAVLWRSGGWTAREAEGGIECSRASGDAVRLQIVGLDWENLR